MKHRGNQAAGPGPARKQIRGWAIASGACLVFLLLLFLANQAYAAPVTDADQAAQGAQAIQAAQTGGYTQALQILQVLTTITLVPALLIMLTGFTRIIIILALVRNAIGLQNMPPNIVLIGLSLFITYFVMSPVLGQVNQVAYQPYAAGEIQLEEAGARAMTPLRGFMLKQTYQSDLDFFADIYGQEPVESLDEIPNSVVIMAFMTSELKHAFAIGFFLYVPFIVIDMIVSVTIMAMGMMMLPPAMISLPFKILLFVLVDGWQLTIGTSISSFAA